MKPGFIFKIYIQISIKTLENTVAIGAQRVDINYIPVNLRHRSDIGLMLANHLPRWPSINRTSGQCLMFAEIMLVYVIHYVGIKPARGLEIMRV